MEIVQAMDMEKSVKMDRAINTQPTSPTALCGTIGNCTIKFVSMYGVQDVERRSR